MHVSIRLLPVPRMGTNHHLVPVSTVCVTLTAYLSVCDSRGPASNIQHKRSQTYFLVESADAHNGLQT